MDHAATWPGVGGITKYAQLVLPPLFYQKKGDKTMEHNAERMAAALELLRFKAARQMCEGKKTVALYESDIQEILFVAGIKLEKELEVI
jgi:hypothetical protein